MGDALSQQPGTFLSIMARHPSFTLTGYFRRLGHSPLLISSTHTGTNTRLRLSGAANIIYSQQETRGL
jgi:hypothetical protein